MPRLVHLTRASSGRGIERAGIRGELTSIRGPRDQSVRLARAVFAMPLVPDFAVTYQWLRELRRWHGERMVAVHFLLSSDEEVFVGRYNTPHRRLPLREAIRRVLDEPRGNEIIIPRAVRRRELIALRDLPQLVGWTEMPDRESFDCLCQVCVPAGMRDLMHRVRGTFERRILEARKARTSADVARVLGCLDVPLERARGRLSPDKLLAFTRARESAVRRAATDLLGYFRWTQVEDVLVTLLDDTDAGVRELAVQSLVRAGGLRRAHAHVASRDDTIPCFVEHLEHAADAELAVRLLSELAELPTMRRHARVIKAATTLMRDDALSELARRRLESIVEVGG